VPLRDGELLHQEIPHSRLVVFRECGHLPHEEYPAEFVKVVTSFCSDRLAPAAEGTASPAITN
jgi:pimeloyl-ACP methyl ester carboxylesterase